MTSSSGPVSEYDGVWNISVLAVITFCLVFSGQIFAILIGFLLVTASRRLYNKMFEAVLRAPIYFFETNPVGKFFYFVDNARPSIISNIKGSSITVKYSMYDIKYLQLFI